MSSYHAEIEKQNATKVSENENEVTSSFARDVSSQQGLLVRTNVFVEINKNYVFDLKVSTASTDM